MFLAVRETRQHLSLCCVWWEAKQGALTCSHTPSLFSTWGCESGREGEKTVEESDDDEKIDERKRWSRGNLKGHDW